MIKTPPPQRVGQFAGAVRRQHHVRDGDGADRAEFGDGDLEIGQELEQESLELVVGAVDLIDQQHRRLSRRMAASSGRSSRYFSEKIWSSIASASPPRCAWIASSWRW